MIGVTLPQSLLRIYCYHLLPIFHILSSEFFYKVSLLHPFQGIGALVISQISVEKEAAACIISATSFVAGGVWWTQPGTKVTERVIS